MAIHNIFPRGEKAITVLWRLEKQDGTPYSINGMGFRLSYRTAQGEEPIESAVLSADGSELSWTLVPKKQKFFGAYTVRLELIDNRAGGTGKKLSDIVFNNAFHIERPIGPMLGNEGLVQSAYVADDKIALTTVAEFGMFNKELPLYAGQDGFWYLDGEPLKDGDGNYVATTHTVEYDPETFLIYVDKGKVDPDGVSQEIVIDAFVNVKQTTEEAKKAVADAEEALAGARQVIDEALYSELVEEVEGESELVNASKAAAKAVNAAEAAIAIAKGLLESVHEAEEALDAHERIRIAAETARTAAETARSQAETARAEAETLRAQAFTDAQNSRQQAFDASQTARTNTFNASEQSRANTFAQTEAAREQATAIIQQEAAKLTDLERNLGELAPYTDADLAFGDSNGYEIVRFENGHIKTKNFDSNDAATKAELENSVFATMAEVDEVDLDICDNRNYAIAAFAKGHIRTKKFNSETDAPCVDGGVREGLSFEDETGHAIMDIHGGIPYTKNFNGEDVREGAELAKSILLRFKNNIPIGIDSRYTEDTLKAIAEKVNGKNSIVDGFSFAFITDLHFQNNPLQSKYLLKYILDNTSVNFAISGGDYTAAYGNDVDIDFAAKTFRDYVACIGKERFFSVRGNHDFTIKESSSSSEGVTKPFGFTYDVLARTIESNPIVEINAEHFAWVLTNETHKVKVFGVNSCDSQGSGAYAVNYYISVEQMKWIAQHIENGYRYIFVSHIATSPNNASETFSVTSQKPLRDLMLAMKNKSSYTYSEYSKDFSSFDGEIICHICGHEHSDKYDYADGILEILTTSDAYHGNDQAFDVFAFDFANKTIKTTRIGVGADRVFNY